MGLDKRLKEIKERCEKATEEWRDIPGFKYYQVSNWGRVRSPLNKGNHKVKCGKDYRVLATHAVKDGRKKVNIKKDITYITKTVASLVMLAFVGERPEGLEVAHLNGDASDDRLDNLKYCTRKENESHKKIHGTSPEGSNNPMAKFQDWQVDEIRFLASKSVAQGKIAKLFDVDHKLISAVVNKTNYVEMKTRQDVPMLLAMVEYLRDELTECERENDVYDYGHDTQLLQIAEKYK